MVEEKISTAESLMSTRTYGQVRCHNPTCTSRITPAPGESKVKCPRCGSEWRIFWVKSGFPRIRGPVWEISKKLAADKMAKVEERKEEK